MAPMLFSKAILAGKPIKVFNNGNLSRDFTYIDDIIEGVVRVIDGIPQINDGETISPKVYNIGCGHPMSLMDFIHTLEEHLGMKAQMYMLPMQKVMFIRLMLIQRDWSMISVINLRYLSKRGSKVCWMVSE